jgi:hypothetical protein
MATSPQRYTTPSVTMSMVDGGVCVLGATPAPDGEGSRPGRRTVASSTTHRSNFLLALHSQKEGVRP